MGLYLLERIGWRPEAGKLPRMSVERHHTYMGHQDKRITFRYYMIFGVSYLFSLLPLRLLYILSDLFFVPVYYWARYRREVVRENLTKSFPEKTVEEIRSIEKKFYHYLCDCFVETVKLTSISPKTMRKHMVFHGAELVEEACRKSGNHFVFVFLGHYGNWEWIASLPYWVSPEVLCTQIYHPLYNKAMDRFFLRLRNHFGGECIPMKSTLRRIVGLKKEGRPVVVGFISDQLPKWEAMHFFVPFLHRDTAVFTGAEQIGRQVKAEYFFAEVTRPRRGYYECTFKPMEYPRETVTDYDMTARFMQMLEKMIREHPQYWLWTHKRWKRTKEEWLARQKHAKTN